MAERAHPFDSGFQDTIFGLKKNPYKKALYKRYKFCNAFIKDDVVLDIPCGTGWGTSLLRGYRNLIGMDIDTDSVAFAQKHYSKKNIQYLVGSMESIPLPDNDVDVIICLEGFEHIKREQGIIFLAEAKRVLKKDGRIILTSPVIEPGRSGSGNPYHLYEYPEKELVNVLNEHFQFIMYKKDDGPDLPIVYFIGKNAKS